MDRLLKLWDGFDEEILKEVYAMTEPQITVVMLSYIRYDLLLRTLRNLYENVSVPLNIVLRVQGARRLDYDGKMKIKDTLGLFNKHHLSFTEKNHGTGVPRWQSIHKALEFGTPYLFFTDDDMIYQKDSVEAMMSILKQYPKIGAVAVSCKPNYHSWNVAGNRLSQRPHKSNKLDYVDAMGSATTIMRREVFNTCDYDKRYYIGLADFDLCLQIKKQGWKCAIIPFEELKAVNDRKVYPEYKKVRSNHEHITNSRKLFYKKWGLYV